MPDLSVRTDPAEAGSGWPPSPPQAESDYRSLMTALLVERYGAAPRPEPKRENPVGPEPTR